MRMMAIRPWRNFDHEGVVEPGFRFEAGHIRAQELERLGLAVRAPALRDGETVVVRADGPQKPTRVGRRLPPHGG